MTLQVHTARISSTDPDRLDITRKAGSVFGPSWELLGDGKSGRISWDEYVFCYRVEMRDSYREHRATWDELLSRERVVLACYCVDYRRCHRRLLAGILTAFGAENHGEVQL